MCQCYDRAAVKMSSISIPVAYCSYCMNLSRGHECHRCVLMCVHVNNPSLTVPHVVSLNMPTKTAPVGSNPFEDDEDEDEEEEEEVALEQQSTVNHISVNREENKTLVIRSKLSSILQSSHPFSISLFFFTGSSLSVLYLRYLYLVTISPPLGGRLLCCSAWSLEWHYTQSQCVSVLRS